MCLYAAFALIAAGINFAVQEFAYLAWPYAARIPASLLAGTLAGLAAKYALDRRFIFFHHSNGLADEGRTFVRYLLTALVTTAIFWAFELGFALAFEEPRIRYVGAAIGLALGYCAKFQLDRRFVFPHNSISNVKAR